MSSGKQHLEPRAHVRRQERPVGLSKRTDTSQPIMAMIAFHFCWTTRTTSHSAAPIRGLAQVAVAFSVSQAAAVAAETDFAEGNPLLGQRKSPNVSYPALQSGE